MTRIQITIPNHDTGKQEEIELLKKLTDNMSGSQSYLASLFTQPLFEWAADMIKEDFSPNLFLNYQEAHDKIRDGAQALNEANRDLDDHKAAIEEQKKSIVLLCEESNGRQERIGQLENDRQEYVEKWHNSQTEAYHFKSDLDGAKYEIRNLKAQLFDALVKTGEIETVKITTNEPETMSDEQLDKIRASDEPKYNYKYDDQS